MVSTVYANYYENRRHTTPLQYQLFKTVSIVQKWGFLLQICIRTKSYYSMTQKASDKKYIANLFNRSDIFLSISEISINTTYNSTSTYYCTVKQFTSSLCLTIFSHLLIMKIYLFFLPASRTNPPRNNQFLNSIA